MSERNSDETTIQSILQELQISNVLKVMKMISAEGELLDKKRFEAYALKAKSILRELKR